MTEKDLKEHLKLQDQQIEEYRDKWEEFLDLNRVYCRK